MKKYKYYLLLLLVTMVFFSCEKETEDVSRITYYCDVELEGDPIVLIALGTDYVEPGYTASEGDEDVTESVTVSGEVNTSQTGQYTLSYTAVNSDGFPKTITRTVIVYDPTPSPIESGFYHVSPQSTRVPGPSTEFESSPAETIYQSTPGVFYISDLFGGYYSVGRGYGPAYATGGYVAYDGTNFSLVESEITPWGNKFSSVSGTYDQGTKTLFLAVVWESGYTFNLIIIKD